MEQNYPYLINVTWDVEIENLETAKKALKKYFNLQKKSDGGDCEIHSSTRRSMLLGYKDKEAQKRVLQKRHTLKVEGIPGVLDLEVFPVDEIKARTVPPPNSSTFDNAAVAPPTSSRAVRTHRSGDEENRGRTADMETSHAYGAAGPSEYAPQHPPLETEKCENASTDMDASGDNDRSRNRKEDQRARNGGEAEGNALSDNSSEGSNYTFQSDAQDISAKKEEDQRVSSSEQRDNDGSRERKKDELAQKRGEGEENTLPTNSSEWVERKFPSDGQDITVKKGEDQRVSSGGQRANDGKTYTEDVEREPRNKRKSSTNSEERPRPPTVPNINELFRIVEAELNDRLIDKTVIKEIKETFPSLIKETSQGVKMKGTFPEIGSVYDYLQRRLTEMRSWNTPMEEARDTPMEEARNTRTEESPPEMKADHVCVPTALCEYVMEVYQMKVQDMEDQYRVKLVPEAREDGTTYIQFIPQGPGSSVEAAKEKFTEKVQTAMNDWHQETVDSASAHMPFYEIKQCLKSQFSNILVIQEGKKIVLRGPKEELVQAKRCLEKGQYEPSHPPRTEPSHPPKPVSISTRDMKTEIPVDARHLDILRKLKKQEICDIEKKYNVMLVEKKEKNGSILITFRPVNGSPDLSPHAAHSFITLLQKTFFNIKQKVISVKSDVSQDQVCDLEEQLKMGGVNVIMEYSRGSVVIIGHTSLVAFAEETLTGHQKLGKAPAVAPPKSDTQEPMDTSESASNKPKPAEEEDKCPVCLCEIEDKVTFPKCKHGYCRPCLKELMSHKPVCAICGVACGEVRGNQPEGTMSWRTYYSTLPGFPGCGTIEISYYFPGGTQQENHPHPGKYYSGTSRTAYLPDNPEGRDILRLLGKAFEQKLIFTVGDSRTSGLTDTVTWNDVHHKTSTHGGPQSFGYPDPEYLKRVRDELKAKGVE